MLKYARIYLVAGNYLCSCPNEQFERQMTEDLYILTALLYYRLVQGNTL
jgi:hypothetical protein